MTYSVRDLAIVTAYTAVLLSQNPLLNTILFIVSFTGLGLVALIFGLATIKEVFRPKFDSRGIRASAPLFYLPIVWFVVVFISIRLFDSHPFIVGSIMFAMFFGLASASIPLMFHLDMREKKLSYKTQWVGYWSLVAASGGAGLVSILVLSFQGELGRLAESNFYRVPSIVGMLASVLATWYLLGTKSIYDEPKERYRSRR